MSDPQDTVRELQTQTNVILSELNSDIAGVLSNTTAINQATDVNQPGKLAALLLDYLSGNIQEPDGSTSADVFGVFDLLNLWLPQMYQQFSSQLASINANLATIAARLVHTDGNGAATLLATIRTNTSNTVNNISNLIATQTAFSGGSPVTTIVVLREVLAQLQASGAAQTATGAAQIALLECICDATTTLAGGGGPSENEPPADALCFDSATYLRNAGWALQDTAVNVGGQSCDLYSVIPPTGMPSGFDSILTPGEGWTAIEYTPGSEGPLATMCWAYNWTGQTAPVSGQRLTGGTTASVEGWFGGQSTFEAVEYFNSDDFGLNGTAGRYWSFTLAIPAGSPAPTNNFFFRFV